jgi:hypothetical protein
MLHLLASLHDPNHASVDSKTPILLDSLHIMSRLDGCHRNAEFVHLLGWGLVGDDDTKKDQVRVEKKRGDSGLSNEFDDTKKPWM